MADALWMKLRKVRWENYEVSPASKKQVPRILEALSSRKEPRAMKAAHDLWITLCSNKIWSAAEPTCPFLIEILGIAQPAIQGEILDLLIKFTDATHQDPSESWQFQLDGLLKAQKAFITKLSYSRDTIVADKAHRLLDKISK